MVPIRSIRHLTSCAAEVADQLIHQLDVSIGDVGRAPFVLEVNLYIVIMFLVIPDDAVFEVFVQLRQQGGRVFWLATYKHTVKHGRQSTPAHGEALRAPLVGMLVGLRKGGAYRARLRGEP
jgi:hypothetical protein